MSFPSRNVSDPEAQQNFDELAKFLMWGPGTPENRITASPGVLYVSTDGGGIFYKDTGEATNTGWVAR